MKVMIDNRLEFCRDTCPYAEISADVDEYRTLGGVCAALVTIECQHSGVCRFESDGGGKSDGEDR